MNQNISDVIEAIKAYRTVPLRGVQVLVTELADYLRSISGEPDLVLVLSRRLKDAFANIDGAAEAPGSAEDTQALHAQIGALTEHASGLEQKLAAAMANSEKAVGEFSQQLGDAMDKLQAKTAEAAELQQELATIKAAAQQVSDAVNHAVDHAGQAVPADATEPQPTA